MPSILSLNRNDTPADQGGGKSSSESNLEDQGEKRKPQLSQEFGKGLLHNHDKLDQENSGSLSMNGYPVSARVLNSDPHNTVNGRLSESSRSERSSKQSIDAASASTRQKNVIKRKDLPNGVHPAPITQAPTPLAISALATSQTSSPPSSPSKYSTRHRRAQSASNPGSPIGSPFHADYTRLESNTAGNRLSSPSNQELGPNASSLSLQRPGSLRLAHRHTLQVPKLPMARGSRDFSFQYANPSEEAMATALPSGGGWRPSLNLARRNTRSIHSDMYLDEIPQDPDAARWAETVRQKRASRRKRKEEEEDDRVMVGTKVDQNHVNYVTAYNMLTGIRFTVSRTNAKMDRELTDADFDAKHKFSFDITGNELTPSAKYDFKFKDYAPWVFRHLRATFHLDPADYLISLTSKYILSELGSPGKSGSFFYFSRDYKYIIKTIHHAEHKLLRKILREYYTHVQSNPNTLISQFYGLHRVKIPYGRKIHFVVMNNLFPPHRDIHQTFDLKGSTIGRELREEDLEKNPRATLKDLNWLRRNYHLEFGPTKKRYFIEQMERDVALLRRLKIMDYSLLVGIHDLERGNEENLRDKTLKVFQPGGDRPDEPRGSVLIRTPSKMENAQKARELRQIIKRERPVPMNQSTFQMPDEPTKTRQRSYFYSDDGGFRATHEHGEPGEEIYYLGIIDCLTHYGFVKRLEHFWKGMSANKTQISPIPPEGYGDRFVKFISGITMPREEAAAQTQQEMQQLDGTVRTAPSTQVHSPVREAVETQTSNRIARWSPDQVVEVAEHHARRSGSSEEEMPERYLKTKSIDSAERGLDRGASITLPVLEEVGEGGSTGGRSHTSANSRERERDRSHSQQERNEQGVGSGTIVEEYNEEMEETATGKRAREREPQSSSGGGGSSSLRNRGGSSRDPASLAPQSHLSPPLGGRPPPTPPKDVPSLEMDTTTSTTTTTTTTTTISEEQPPVIPMPELPTSPLNMGRASWLAS